MSRNLGAIRPEIIAARDYENIAAAPVNRKCYRLIKKSLIYFATVQISEFLLEVHHQQLGFGHFFDGVAQSFTAQS